MIDVILGGAIASGLIYAANNYQAREPRKIDAVLRRINYRSGNLRPKLTERRRKDNAIEYVYKVPPGLIADPRIEEILTETLRKPVKVSFRGVLIIRVYNKDVSRRVEYDWGASNGWAMPIGQTLDGVLYHDFDKHPHMTVAGMTRHGKTALLKLILAHLINSQPVNSEIYLIDLKGGIEFGKYRNLSQVKAVADSVESAESTLRDVLTRLRYDMSKYAKNGYSNAFEANQERRVFIITDEAAELADSPRCLSALSEICRIGGALGYRNIFATQYPTADTLPRQVKQNSDARVSFRLPTEVASRVALDESGAEELVGAGRAIYRTHERHIIQVPYVSDNEILKRLADHISEKEDDIYADETQAEDKSSGTNIIDISGFDLRNQRSD